MSTPDPFKKLKALEDSIAKEKNSGKRQRMKDALRRTQIELGRSILISKQEELDAKNPKVPTSQKVTKAKNVKTKTQ